jgi:hypothetical protein
LLKNLRYRPLSRKRRREFVQLLGAQAPFGYEITLSVITIAACLGKMTSPSW